MYVVVATEGSFLKEHKNLKLFCCTQQGRVTEVFYQLRPPPRTLFYLPYGYSGLWSCCRGVDFRTWGTDNTARRGSEVGHSLGVASEPGSRTSCRSKPWKETDFYKPRRQRQETDGTLKSWLRSQTHRKTPPPPPPAADEEPGSSGA